jgi:hypothetical protein
MKLMCCRVPGGLRPLYDADELALSKVKIGDAVTIELKKHRNPKRNALYWALISKVFDNQDRYETIDQLHNAVKLAAGIYDIIELPNGQQYRIPGSTAFDKMDETTFAQFMDRTFDLVAKHFLPGITDKELRAEIAEMIGMAA